VRTTYPERLGRFFGRLLPTVLGVRHAFTGNWLLGPVGVVLLLGAVAVLGLVIVRMVGDPAGRRALEPLLVVLFVFPFLFAIPKASHYVVEPRYGLMLTPVVTLLLASLLVNRARRVGALVGAVLLAILTVAALLDVADRNPMLVDLSPPPLEDLEETLDAAGVDRVFADYWIAYPLTFETGERIVGTPVDAVRSAQFDRIVREADPSTYVVFLNSPRDRALGTALRDGGYEHERVETGEFAVYLLNRRLGPESISSAFGM